MKFNYEFVSIFFNNVMGTYVFGFSVVNTSRMTRPAVS